MGAKDAVIRGANLETANLAPEAIKKNTMLIFDLQDKLKNVQSKATNDLWYGLTKPHLILSDMILCRSSLTIKH